MSQPSEPNRLHRVITKKGRPRHPKSSALFYGMIVVWLSVGVIALLLGALLLGYRFPPFIRS
jgi:hypothetical protein